MSTFSKRVDNALRDGLSQEDYDRTIKVQVAATRMAEFVETLAIRNSFVSKDSLLDIADKIDRVYNGLDEMDSDFRLCIDILRRHAVTAMSIHSEVSQPKLDAILDQKKGKLIAVKEMLSGDNGDVIQKDAWLESRRLGAFVRSDGEGVWAKANLGSVFKSSIDAFNETPDWADCVVWYNK